MSEAYIWQNIDKIIGNMSFDLIASFDRLIAGYGSPKKLIDLSVINAEIPIQFFIARCLQEFEARTEKEIGNATKRKILYLIFSSGVTKKAQGRCPNVTTGITRAFKSLLIAEGATSEQARVISGAILQMASVMKHHFKDHSGYKFIGPAIDDFVYFQEQLCSRGRLQTNIRKVFTDPSYHERNGVYSGIKVSAHDKDIIDDIVMRVINCAVIFSFYAGESPHQTLDSIICESFSDLSSMIWNPYYDEHKLKYTEAYLQSVS